MASAKYGISQPYSTKYGFSQAFCENPLIYTSAPKKHSSLQLTRLSHTKQIKTSSLQFIITEAYLMKAFLSWQSCHFDKRRGLRETRRFRRTTELLLCHCLCHDCCQVKCVQFYLCTGNCITQQTPHQNVLQVIVSAMIVAK